MDSRPAFDRLEPIFGSFIESFAELSTFIEITWPKTEADYPPNINQTLRFFIGAMISRARAAFMLLQAGSCWESEIILRSLLEAAVKCATFACRRNVAELLEEFWVELQASSDRKAALRAAMAQEIFPRQSTDRPIFAAIQNPEWFEIAPKANKQRRRILDHQWSLPELIRKLLDHSETRRPLVGFDAMLHSYGLQSEITHVSAKYYDLLWDRMIRGKDLIPLENTHYCRQMADAIHLTAFCVTLSLECLDVATEQLGTPIRIANAFSDTIRPFQNAFDESQGFI